MHSSQAANSKCTPTSSVFRVLAHPGCSAATRVQLICGHQGQLMVSLEPRTIRHKVRVPTRLRRLAGRADSAQADDGTPTRHATHGCLCMRRYESARSFRPPGRLMFLRPVKSAAQVGQARRRYDAVWLAQEVNSPPDTASLPFHVR